MTAARVELYAVIDSLSSIELFHLAEARWQLERRVAEERIAALADVFWGRALGAYRTSHHPPAFPADAPAPLPLRRREKP